MHEKHTGGALMGFIAGAAVGAALGTLLAPRSGREIRSAIGARYQSSAERAKELAGVATGQARVVGQSAAESAHAAVETARRKAERLSDKAHERITAVTPS